MRSLYDIRMDFELAMDEAISQAEEGNGEISDYLANWLDGLEIERVEKLEALTLWVKSLKAEAEMVGNEIKALQERKSSCVNKMESVKHYLSTQLKYGVEKHSFASATIGWRKSEIVSVLCDVNELPLEYVRIKKEIDKTAIKKGIKDGNEFEFARLETKQNIQIK